MSRTSTHSEDTEEVICDISPHIRLRSFKVSKGLFSQLCALFDKGFNAITHHLRLSCLLQRVILLQTKGRISHCLIGDTSYTFPQILDTLFSILRNRGIFHIYWRITYSTFCSVRETSQLPYTLIQDIISDYTML